MTSGDECYPQKIVLGDFLRIIEDEGRDKSRLPHAHRQRALPVRPVPAPHPQQVRRAGLQDVPVHQHHLERRLLVASASYAQDLIRTAWRAVLAQDILMKLLLKTRPYEREKGCTDAAYLDSLEDAGRARSAWQSVSHKERMAALVAGHGRAPANASAPCPPTTTPRGRSSASSARSSAARTRSPTSTSSGIVEEQGGECWLAGHRGVGLVHRRRAAAAGCARRHSA